MAEPALDFLEMYLFDTSGVVHLRGTLTQEEIAQSREELRSLPEVPYGIEAATRWERLTHDSDWFRGLATDARLVHRVREVINQPLRLLESYAVHREAGSELMMHGGAAELMDLSWGSRATKDVSVSHTYKDGKLYCLYVKALLYLDDVQSVEDGLFTWLIGSHKANFPLLRPWHQQPSAPRLSLAELPNLRRQPVRAGDMLLINESVLHGTTHKISPGPRRIVAFSYGPSFMADWREINSTDALDIHDQGYADSDVEEGLLAGGPAERAR